MDEMYAPTHDWTVTHIIDETTDAHNVSVIVTLSVCSTVATKMIERVVVLNNGFVETASATNLTKFLMRRVLIVTNVGERTPGPRQQRAHDLGVGRARHLQVPALCVSHG